MIKKEGHFKHKLLEGLQTYFKINLAFFIVLIFIRLFELIYISIVHKMPAQWQSVEMYAIISDLVTSLELALILIIPFLTIYMLKMKLGEWTLKITIILLIIIYIMLIVYYVQTLLLLGEDFYGYSLAEIQMIIKSSGNFSWLSVIPFVIFIALFITFTWLINKIRFHKYFSIGYLLLILSSVFYTEAHLPNSTNFKDYADLNLSSNKMIYFSHESYSHFYNREPKEANAYFDYFYKGINIENNDLKYLSDDYPFLRVDNSGDVLSSFFKKTDKKPNIVFILVESLGSAYSGDNAYLKSFTPFVDSLSKHSLYWINSLSTSGRTFEVLPSVLGSLPYGKNGFCEMAKAMPNHQSIVRQLINNGYKASFYYGGDAKFDNMDMFMLRQGKVTIVDQSKFEPIYKKIPPTASGFTWGYCDHELFDKYLIDINKSVNPAQPRIDVILTLAMHDPYILPNQDFYNKKFDKYISKLNLSADETAEYKKYMPNYASIIYFDDAIRNFFKYYSKRADYGNTIFVITGDHRMTTPPISTQIDRFRVPIIIYSPLLKNPQKFLAVNSHLDIAPSLLKLLKNTYEISVPNTCHWLGTGLDTMKTYRNIHSMPFVRTKFELADYLDYEYYIYNEQLFKLSDNLVVEQITDNIKLQSVKTKLERFKTKNIKACTENKLLPDSLLQ